MTGITDMTGRAACLLTCQLARQEGRTDTIDRDLAASGSEAEEMPRLLGRGFLNRKMDFIKVKFL